MFGADSYARNAYASYRFSTRTLRWLRRRLTPAGWLVLGGVAITGARGDTNMTVGYQAFTLLSCVMGVALIGSLFARGRFEVRRALPRMGSAGVPLHYEIQVVNPTRRRFADLTLWEDLEDPRPTLAEFLSTPEPGEEKRNWFDRTARVYRWRWLVAQKTMAEVKAQRVPRLAARGGFGARVELVPRKRGWLRFEGITVGCPDLFGLFRALARVAARDSLLILPKRYPLPPLAMPGTRKYQIGGIAMAAAVGESDEFVSLREYRPGDPLRRIHWRSWAKSGKPIVKEYQDEFFVRHALILDTFCEDAYSEVFEEAVSVAASFACSLETRDSLLDLLFVGPKAYCFTIGRGLAHADQMLEILAAVRTCRDQPFARLRELAIEHGALVSGVVLVLLRWDEERRRLVEQLRGLRVPMRVLVIQEAGAAATLDPGPLRDQPECFHVLPVDKIAEKLAGLS